MYVCMYVCMYVYISVYMDISPSLAGFQQPPGAPKSSQCVLQVDPLWIKISALGTLSPLAGSPGILKNNLCFNF